MGKLGSRSTALDVVKGLDLSGKTALVTGGNSGLGAETARAFAKAGATVILTSRDVAKGHAKADEIATSVSNGKLEVIQLDLSDLASIKSCAQKVEELAPKRGIDYFICNAGVMACPYKLTPAGFEWQIGVNVFGHFYLVQLLEKSLRAQEAPCRIVVLASSAHSFGDLDLDDLHFKRRNYSAWKAYGQSKLANIMWAKALNQRFANSNVAAFSVHPGIIFSNLWRHSYFGYLALVFGYAFTKSSQQGAATQVYAAVEPSLKGHAGAFLQDCQVDKPEREEAEDLDLSEKFYDIVNHQINQALLDVNSQVGQQIHS